MSIGVWNLDWLNHNENRAYPIAADATRLDVTSTFKLPNNFIADLTLSVSPSAVNCQPSNFFVYQLTSLASGYSLVLGYQPATGAVLRVAVISVDRSAFVPYTTYRLRGVDNFTDVEGYLTLGHLDLIDAQPAGLFTFNLAGGRLEVSAIHPQLRGVTGLTAVNSGNESDVMRGVVKLVAGRNCRLTLENGSAGNVIRIDFISGEGTVASCNCDTDVTLGSPIYSINGVSPNAAGELSLVGDACLQVTTGSSSISFEDKCSQPCCACPEYAAVKSALQLIEAKLRTVENFASRLDSTMAQFSGTILSTALKDRLPENCTP